MGLEDGLEYGVHTQADQLDRMKYTIYRVGFIDFDAFIFRFFPDHLQGSGQRSALSATVRK